MLLFRQQGLHLPLVPFVRFSYPQFNLRLYVVDDDGVPSVYFHTVLVPGWVVPAARAVGQLPAAAAHFRYPPPSREVPAGSWEWRVRRGSSLRVEASQSSPMVGEGPPLGSWDDTVRYFRERPRGYAEVAGELRRVDTEQPRVAVWPVAAAVTDAGLLADCLPLGRAGAGGDGRRSRRWRRRRRRRRRLAAPPLGLVLPRDPVHLRVERRRQDRAVAAHAAGGGQLAIAALIGRRATA